MTDAIKLAIDALERAVQISDESKTTSDDVTQRQRAIAALRAQPDHSELVKKLRHECAHELHFETSHLLNEAADALEGKALGETT